MNTNNRKRTKSANWSYTEVLALIKVCKEENIVKPDKRKRYKNAEVFQFVMKRMRKLGFDRTVQQIIFKFKLLKKQYSKARRFNIQPNFPYNFKYFNEMKDLMEDKESPSSPPDTKMELLTPIKYEIDNCQYSHKSETSPASINTNSMEFFRALMPEPAVYVNYDEESMHNSSNPNENFFGPQIPNTPIEDDYENDNQESELMKLSKDFAQRISKIVQDHDERIIMEMHHLQQQQHQHEQRLAKKERKFFKKLFEKFS